MEFPRWQSDPSKAFTIRCGSSSLEETVQETAALKSSDQYSCLRLEFDREPQQEEAKSRRVAECISDLLQANSNIKSLVVRKCGDARLTCGAWMHIFEALSTDAIGNRVEHLNIARPSSISNEETAVLTKYLTANTNIKSLSIRPEASSVQMVCGLISSNITSLRIFCGYDSDEVWFSELGARLRQYTSISTLLLQDYRSSTNPRFFTEGIAKMHSLKHFEIRTYSPKSSSSRMLATIASFVHQHGALETVSIETEFKASMSDHLKTLSSALSYVKGVSFTSRRWSEDSHYLAAALQGLTCVESLEVDFGAGRAPTKTGFLSMCSVVASLRTLESIAVRLVGFGTTSPDWAENAFLEIVKACNSITKADLQVWSASLSCSFKHQVAYYCFWNKKASFAKLQVAATGIWPHVLSSPNLSHGRASIVYRLLSEMPWLLVPPIRE